MQKALLFIFICMLVTFQTVLAQTRTVTGVVTSGDDGQPLPGVSVLIKGTTEGTSTQVDGRYSLTVPANATLVYTFVGMGTQEIVVGQQTTINVTLKTSAADLNEVVVVGYGTQLKADLTGSIARVAGKEIENLPITSVEQGLQGRTCGWGG